MKKNIFKITLRNSLDPEAPVLLDIGEAKTNKEAEDIAYKFINNPANLKVLGCKSLYVRSILYSEVQPICTGMDYGSYSRFIFIKEEIA